MHCLKVYIYIYTLSVYGTSRIAVCIVHIQIYTFRLRPGCRRRSVHSACLYTFRTFNACTSCLCIYRMYTLVYAACIRLPSRRRRTSVYMLYIYINRTYMRLYTFRVYTLYTPSEPDQDVHNVAFTHRRVCMSVHSHSHASTVPTGAVR
jgi:hypothetical protein